MNKAPVPRLTTVSRFRDPYLAELARGALESEGMFARLHFAEFVRVNWLISDAIGGIHLQVPESESDRAREILEGDAEADLDLVEECSIPPEERDLCPECHSDAVRADSLERTSKCMAYLVTMNVAPFPFAVGRHRYRCDDCGHSFRAVDPQRTWTVMSLTHLPALLWYLGGVILGALVAFLFPGRYRDRSDH